MFVSSCTVLFYCVFFLWIVNLCLLDFYVFYFCSLIVCYLYTIEFYLFTYLAVSSFITAVCAKPSSSIPVKIVTLRSASRRKTSDAM